MSTVILGQLAKPDPAGLTADDDSKKHWLEALAAIIPGEALIAATGFLTYFTVKAEDGATSLSNDWAVRITTVVIALAIPFLYGGNSGHIFGLAHVIRWFVALVAFAAWLWLLPLSVWDTFAWVTEEFDANERAGYGIGAAILILAVAGFLFKTKPVPPET
jgi:hypothetical protein